MRHFKYSAPFLITAAILLYPLIASADSITSLDVTLTASQEADGYTTMDNVVGRLTSKKKGIPDIKITIKNPRGTVIGTGTTDKEGNYNIDTDMNDVAGMTLTFECDYIDGEMTM